MSKLGRAHSNCKEKCEHAMQAEEERIFVANTNTTRQEFTPYFTLAQKYGYTVFSMVVENYHGNTSVHDVPNETIEKMKRRFQIQL